MEDFLPILIGIIWVAYTLYNKGKKKDQIKHPIASEKREKKPLSIFEQILMGEEIKIPQPYAAYSQPEEPLPIPTKEINYNKEKKSTRPFLMEELGTFTEEGQSVSGLTQHENTIERILLEQDLELAESDFDIRKAVIYSEILNAPYIGYK